MEPKYTPAKIANAKFEIPIYQRLFEWEDKQITQLLGDLLEGYTKAPNRPYYIGMLTSKSGSVYELVDGQQRFTVAMLMGTVMQKFYPKWKDFILLNGTPRLSFLARPEDQSYLQELIKHFSESEEEMPSMEYENGKMKNGIKTIRSFLSEMTKNQCESFSQYVYNELTFFVSILPEHYNAASLNKYFERMNSTGKNLEGHEVLKVKILGDSRFPSDKRELYTQLWNRVSEMDSPLFDVRDYLKNDRENTAGMKKRIELVLGLSKSSEILRYDSNNPNYAYLNGLGAEIDALGSGKSIRDLPMSPDEPKSKDHFGAGSRSVMNFTELLLQTLYYYYGNSIRDDKQIATFFNPSNLVANFDNLLFNNATGEGFVLFLDRLLRARIMLDVYFIRVSEKDEDLGYKIELPELHGEGDSYQWAEKLRMYESMLYVSSAPVTYYRWFKMLMDCVVNSAVSIPAQTLYRHFIECDNKEHERKKIEDIGKLGYDQPDNRYWFWRLDYYIWLNRDVIFKDNDRARKVADKYVFRRNRSIEHIAPQTPQQEATLKWDDSMNGFGNLAMISSDQNSSLRNAVYQEKRGRVESFIAESRTGTIESLKLLLAFSENQEWDLSKIEAHGERAHQLLLDSYDELIGEE